MFWIMAGNEQRKSKTTEQHRGREGTVPEWNGEILAWYPQHKRDLPWRRDRDPYHVWISEIMLQQTRVAAVIGYYERFMRELPDIETLASVEDDRLMKLWEGLGYYNRARNLKKAALMILERFRGQFPSEPEEIRSLPGIGDYTAGAIASICFGKATPAVDGNVLRVYTRLTADPSCIDLDATKKKVRQDMTRLYEEAEPEDRSLLTQGWMELGATVCVPNGAPLCTECPLAGSCRAHQTGKTGDFPVRAEKKKRRIEERTVFVLLCDGRVAMHKRPKKGLLAGLWEFPGVEGRLSVGEALERAEAWGFAPSSPWMELPYTHIFSHVEWHMHAFFIHCECMIDESKEIGGITWFLRKELEESAAVPSAFRPFRNLLKSGEGLS